MNATKDFWDSFAWNLEILQPSLSLRAGGICRAAAAVACRRTVSVPRHPPDRLCSRAGHEQATI